MGLPHRLGEIAGAYLAKMKGERKSRLPNPLTRANLAESLWAWLGAALGIGTCAFLSARFFEPRAATLIVGSFGASAVLVYGTIRSPLAQPRNLLGGHLISAVVGVTCYAALGEIGWLAAALAVSLAIMAMILTNTVHPPGGATALIAVIGGEQIHRLGFLYPVVPIASGALILLLVAVVVNNLPKHRRYPRYWW